MLQLTHEFADAQARDQHVRGWRFQFSVFANAVADKVNSGAGAIIDRWFSAWSDPNQATWEKTLEEIGATDIRFRDRFSCLFGADDVKAHLAGVHQFMPGVRLERRGEIRHCQWHVLADWVASSSDGQERGRGTNLFVLDADGCIAEVTGFWTA